MFREGAVSICGSDSRAGKYFSKFRVNFLRIQSVLRGKCRVFVNANVNL